MPIPPELVAILREHIERHGVAEVGRLFCTRTGAVFSGSTISKVWKEARAFALTPDRVTSPLAARPYDLRNAAVPLWLNVGSCPGSRRARRAWVETFAQARDAVVKRSRAGGT
ncbi:hypothetical protein SAMN05660976_01800 [Nonomuraea pusilla]|uniref:Tyr recombinase domain-containing protein n=1 Tax=Nonomuraea pusilla TaxID=46177 RepID=A0A1H7MT01_9ACTN|nr:hypothetical protein SAMN05660976_01800 [Nonomuraea pusilla]